MKTKELIEHLLYDLSIATETSAWKSVGHRCNCCSGDFESIGDVIDSDFKQRARDILSDMEYEETELSVNKKVTDGQ